MTYEPPAVDPDEVQFTQGELGLIAQKDVDSQAQLLKWFVSMDDVKEPFGFRAYLTKSIPLSNFKDFEQLDMVDKYMNVILEYHSWAVSLNPRASDSNTMAEKKQHFQYSLFRLAMKRFTRLKSLVESFRGQDAKERVLAATTRLEKGLDRPRQSAFWGR